MLFRSTKILWLALTGPGKGSGEDNDYEHHMYPEPVPDTHGGAEAEYLDAHTSSYRPKSSAPAGPSQAVEATQLFDIVESAANNNMARFIEAGNEVIGPDGAVDRKMAAAEVRERVERAMAVMEGVDQEKLPAETKAALDLLRKNLDQFEADSIVSAVILQARRARRANQKLIIGLETNWIPGINERGYGSQHDAINLLLKEIRSIGQILRELGLDNVEIVEGDGQTLAGSLLEKKDKTGTDLSNIIVLASSATINSPSFDTLRSTPAEKRAFLAGVNAAEIAQFYEDNKEAMKINHQQLRIRIMSMLLITLELAAGKEPPHIPGLSYNPELRIATFLPEPELIDYNMLENTYAGERKALAAA